MHKKVNEIKRYRRYCIKKELIGRENLSMNNELLRYRRSIRRYMRRIRGYRRYCMKKELIR